MNRIKILILVISLTCAGCCSFGDSYSDEDRVHGIRYQLHVKSDFNDSMEIVYWEKFTDRDKNEIVQLLNCYSSGYDESVATASVRVNAFNWYDLETFIETDQLVAVSVNYNGKSAHYVADPAYNVFVRASDFH